MTRIRAACVLTVLAPAALLAAAPAAADDEPVASFYCVITEPLYYQDTQLWAGSRYCVPGPASSRS